MYDVKSCKVSLILLYELNLTEQSAKYIQKGPYLSCLLHVVFIKSVYLSMKTSSFPLLKQT